jgi:CheY-like chemotaxis protein
MGDGMNPQAKKVLLAEDNVLLSKVSMAALRRTGLNVVLAVDGEEALLKARAEAPDLILLDVIMPKMQGFEVLERLRADPATASIPVAMLSNLGQAEDVQQALKAGAQAYFIKSELKGNQLAERVTEMLEMMERGS